MGKEAKVVESFGHCFENGSIVKLESTEGFLLKEKAVFLFSGEYEGRKVSQGLTRNEFEWI